MTDIIIIFGATIDESLATLKRLVNLPSLFTCKFETTCKKKYNEKEGIYQYVGNWDSNSYQLELTLNNIKYGIPKQKGSNVKYILSALDISHFDSILEYRKTYEGTILTIGVENTKSKSNSTENISQKNSIKNCDILVRGTSQDIFDAIVVSIKCLNSRGGVIQKSLLEKFLKARMLLDRTSNKLSPASYDLRLGDDVWCQGEFIKLSESNPVLKIPAYSYVIVTSIEIASLPCFITARFDLKNSLFFRGIILSNGPQIDPGYRGSLFCMLYNGSDQPVGIKRGEHFSTIEFTTTTGVDLGYRDVYQNKTKLIDFMPSSAAVSEGGRILEKTEDNINKLSDEWKQFRNILLATFAFIVSPIILVNFYMLTSWVSTNKDVQAKLNQWEEHEKKIKVYEKTIEENNRQLKELKVINQKAQSYLKKLTSKQTYDSMPVRRHHPFR